MRPLLATACICLLATSGSVASDQKLFNDRVDGASAVAPLPPAPGATSSTVSETLTDAVDRLSPPDDAFDSVSPGGVAQPDAVRRCADRHPGAGRHRGDAAAARPAAGAATAAEAGRASLDAGGLRHAHAGGAAQRPAGAVLHPPAVPGEPFPARRGQPHRRAGHCPVHAEDGRRDGPRQSVRPFTGDPRLGAAAARFVRAVRQSRARRRRLQCRAEAHPGLAVAQGQAAAGDARLRPDHHRTAGGTLEGGEQRHAGREAAAARAVPGGGRPARL